MNIHLNPASNWCEQKRSTTFWPISIYHGFQNTWDLSWDICFSALFFAKPHIQPGFWTKKKCLNGEYWDGTFHGSIDWDIQDQPSKVCANKHRVNHIQSSRNQQGNTNIPSYSIINGLSSLVGWLTIILFESFGTPTRELSSNKETWTLGELLGSSRGIDDQSLVQFQHHVPSWENFVFSKI